MSHVSPINSNQVHTPYPWVGVVDSIFDFIKTRVKIGQLPLIIIDGLDKRVEKWDMLAARIFDLPVKIIVTSREEDWYRYGLDASKAKLNIIDITLLQEEAESIFSQLKLKNKLHKEVKSWQPIWEKIKSKGLLIEYVYLLTHGKMIQERLEQQIKELNKEKDAKAKIEILRIISLADILNIKIQTRKLTAYIQNNINFESDRGELYKILEKEYYIQFDKKYIEGLHPVRSQHLVDILHQNILVEESLQSLLKLIDNNSICDYFALAPSHIEDEKYFLKESATIVSGRGLNAIVDAVDGLMHLVPYIYWKENNKVYSDIYNEGLIQLFVDFNPPFSNLNTLEEMNKVFQNNVSEYAVNQKNKLTTFVFDNTLVRQFCEYLLVHIKDLDIDTHTSYSKLDYLAKWYKKTKINIPKLVSLDDDFLINELESKKIEEVVSLYTYFYITCNEEYMQFIKNNKSTLFSILKQKTNSIMIKERKNELEIQYIVDPKKMDKLNECSVSRIDTFIKYIPRL